MGNFTHFGTWWSDKSIKLAKIDGSVYALHGWNGEKYIDCWKCTGEGYTETSYERYILKPIIEYNEFYDMKLMGYEVDKA